MRLSVASSPDGLRKERQMDLLVTLLDRYDREVVIRLPLKRKRATRKKRVPTPAQGPGLLTTIINWWNKEGGK